MEQAHEYWMWMKRKQMLMMKSHFQASSWEEKAFAEDAASGVLGGCLWPPRSYSCSFCRREFSSAQALGGHMNVHRRDRARLNQSLSFPLNHNQFSSEVCVLEHNSSRVSALRSLENIDYEHDKRLCRVFSISSSSRSKSGEVKKKNSREDQEDCVCKDDHDHDDCVETNLSVGLNSIICSSERESGCSKRAKISTVSSSLPWLLKPCSSGSEVCDVQRSVIEDLDLELRLGDPPN